MRQLSGSPDLNIMRQAWRFQARGRELKLFSSARKKINAAGSSGFNEGGDYSSSNQPCHLRRIKRCG